MKDSTELYSEDTNRPPRPKRPSEFRDEDDFGCCITLAAISFMFLFAIIAKIVHALQAI